MDGMMYSRYSYVSLLVQKRNSCVDAISGWQTSEQGSGCNILLCLMLLQVYAVDTTVDVGRCSFVRGETGKEEMNFMEIARPSGPIYYKFQTHI